MDSQLQRLSHLPSLPTVAVQLLKMFADPEVSISDVVYVLQTDPALSGKILKAANTSQFGMKRPVSDLQRAVVLLGKKSVMALALGFSLAEASMSTGPHANLYSDFWFQSLVRGCAASLIAENYSKVDAGEAFTIGLLARIGRLAMLNCDRDRFVACIQKAQETGESLDLLEEQSASITSMQVTMHLLREWKLPPHCVEAVGQMNVSLEEACENRLSDALTLTDVLRISAAFAEFFSGENRGLAIAKIYELCCTLLGETEEEVNQLVDKVREELDHHSDLFSVDMSKVGSPMELLSQAMGQLSILAANASMNRDDVPPTSSSTEMQEENGRLRKRVLELTQSSITDGLTTLYNRTYLTQHLQERISKSAEHPTQLGVIFVDVDHFKKVNDTHGHLVGDEALRVVARLLKDAVRETDIVARYGGEEFVIVMSVADAAGLSRLAERIRATIEAQTIVCGTVRLRITASFGGCLATPNGYCPELAGRILESADAAMYASKRNGRNRVTIVPDPVTIDSVDRKLQHA
ncbi:sensor domain-containing diguanylate cyclase [Planctomicrobium sp. SH661]|uniref:sensor domain-containing diguanylate cyclase n=1 Tax=Planctomicrobium sp. SH661 TaxID=3448124 RepID=UPI003F5C4F9F